MNALTARNFLIYGMIAGLVAGLAAFVVAYTVGEPHIQTAIELEESHSALASITAHGKSVATGLATHGDEPGFTAEVSRHQQRMWGLLTANLATGVSLGGLVGLVAAAGVGRLGRLRPSQTVGVVTLLGFVSVTLVPFLKYPSTPPAVGDGATIGQRTSLYFGFLLVSVLATVAAVALTKALLDQYGTYAAILAGVGLYLIVMIVAGQVFPTVNEIGDFPADVLWYFRRASLLTTTTTWVGIGVVLAWFVGRASAQGDAVAARKDLAASL